MTASEFMEIWIFSSKVSRSTELYEPVQYTCLYVPPVCVALYKDQAFVSPNTHTPNTHANLSF